jgi:zinc protease
LPSIPYIFLSIKKRKLAACLKLIFVAMKKILYCLCISIIAIASNNNTYAQSKRINFEEYDLPNGLHVILHEDHSVPIAAVGVL